MADFCKACAISLFGEDMGDLAGITSPEDWAQGLACLVLCEGCGPIQVDPSGSCASDGCLLEGEHGHNIPWVGEENV